MYGQDFLACYSLSLSFDIDEGSEQSTAALAYQNNLYMVGLDYTPDLSFISLEFRFAGDMD